jgi:hypothetical protein
LASNQEFAAKIAEALTTAVRCSADENVDNYGILNTQLQELDSSAGQCLQSHAGYRPLVSKLENGNPLTAEELKMLRSLIIGDADYYLKYDDDFDRSKADLGKILDQIRRLQSSEFDPETLMRLRVLCQEASSALVPTVHYLEQKDRVRRFEEHTRGPLDRDAGRVLAGIVKDMMA